MKRKRLLVLTLPALLSSCSLGLSWGKKTSSSSEQGATSSEHFSHVDDADISEDFSDAQIYFGSLDDKDAYALPCAYFDVAEDVPYVSVQDYYEGFFNSAFGNFFSVDGDEVTNRNNLASLVFDAEANEIYSEDFDQFINYSGLKIHSDIFSANDANSNAITSYCEEESSYQKGEELVFDLSSYGMSLIRLDGEVYAPFSVLDTITVLPTGYRFVWNGENFFLAAEECLYEGSALTEYGEECCSGPLFSSSRSESFAEYNYRSFLFEMENFYGRFDDLGVSSLDTKFSAMGIRSNLLSRVPKTADEAIAKAINNLFCDGGHTYFNHRGFGCKYSASEDQSLQQNIYYGDDRYQYASTVQNSLEYYRAQSKTPSTGLHIQGSTAVIRFDEFSLNLYGRSPSKKDVAKDSTSTFAIIYNAFKKIESNSNVKNVVFDVSLNGGGVAIALGQALSFMSDEPVELSFKNNHTGAVSKEAIYVDNDLDGDTEDHDSYAGKYNFYILTSVCSFSCGNAFPCVAKENGWAKIIGSKSGGGDCVVGSGITPDGTQFSMSSNISLIHEDGTSFDSGASVDYELPIESYYDLSALDSFLSSKAS